MGLTSALYSGLSGLNANQFRIDSIGDNIANANTTGFKGSRSMFQTQFAQLLTQGSPPANSLGGTNGIEVGLGAVVGATQRNMQQGSTETTGLPSDLAIDGQGFFIVRSSNNRQAYTRDGSFMLNSDNYMVTADGNYVQGFPIDANYNLVPGVLSDIQVPLGRMTAAKATTSATLEGNLSSDNQVTPQGSAYTTNALVADGAGTPASGATLLTAVRAAGAPATPLFSNGDVIQLKGGSAGVTKGGRGLDTATFTVGTDGTTVDDFMNWMNGTLGINTTAGVPGAPGVSIDAATGIISIKGNTGQDNGLDILSTDIINTSAGNVSPFTLTKPKDAKGADINAAGNSVYTTFTAFDSLGTEVKVNMTMVLESTGGAGGNVWRYYAESPDNVGGNRCIGTGTIAMGANGKAAPGSSAAVTIDRTGTGAVSPMVINMDLTSLSGMVNTGTGSAQESSLAVTLQDGFSPGQLTSYSIGTDGIISGTFSNGLSQTLGQIAVGTFANAAGLTRQTNNLFSEGPNSGQVAITTPDTLGAGRILSGALELSNVDLSREFIGLINASSGFSASSRVITTSNQLLNDLLQLMR